MLSLISFLVCVTPATPRLPAAGIAGVSKAEQVQSPHNSTLCQHHVVMTTTTSRHIAVCSSGFSFPPLPSNQAWVFSFAAAQHLRQHLGVRARCCCQGQTTRFREMKSSPVTAGQQRVVCCALCVVRCSLGPTTAARGIKNMGCKKCSILIGAAAHHAPLLLFCCCSLLCQHSKHIASYMGMCAVQ